MQADATPARHAAGWAALGVFAAAVLAFAGVHDHGFVYLDDPYYVTRNPWIGDGLTAKSVWYSLASRDVWNWHPLTWWSHLLDVELFGMAPRGHHLMSVFLHACAAVAAFGAARAMLQRTGPALFVALGFALHPQRVESVAWVSERKDVLCALFFLLTVWVHLRGGEDTWTRRALRALCCALALAAKPMAVTLPCVLVLLDLWPLGREASARSLMVLVGRKLELFVMVVGTSALTMWAQSREMPFAGPLHQRVTDAAYAVLLYVNQFVVPIGLSYSHPRIDERAPLAVGVLCAVLVLATLAGAAWILIRGEQTQQTRPFAVAWLWFVGVLVPVLGLVRVGGELMSDRYSYLPSIGLLLLLCLGADLLRSRRPAFAPVIRAAAAGIVAVWGVLTVLQVEVWRDDETLVRHAISVSPQNAEVRQTYARALTARRDYEGALALALEFEAIRGDAQGADLVGQALLFLDRRDEARAAFVRALERDPGFPLALVHRAELFWRDGDLGQAEVLLRRALSSERSRRTLTALAALLEQTARAAEAEPLRAEAMSIPEDALFDGPRGAFADRKR